MAFLFTLTVCAFLAASAEAQNASYCAIDCRIPNVQHALCKYSLTVPGKACGSFIPEASKVSATDITTILKVHNDYRRKVANGLETRGDPGPQLKASNMRKLVWDQELADMAQAWAMQCTFERDPCRDVKRFEVGQNVFLKEGNKTYATKNDWPTAIAAWYEDVIHMPAHNIWSVGAEKTQFRYTQIVWANTTSVGCAVTSFYHTERLFFSKQRVLEYEVYNALYVCNYGPAGNFLNSPVYKTGTPGSACPTGTTNQSGLCA